MVEASKLWFERTCGDYSCSELIHPWTAGCVDATSTMLAHCVRGSYRFYAAVYIVQILMKGKMLSREEWVEQFKQYLMSGVFGFMSGSSFVTLNCLFRRLLFSRFNYHTTVLLPCTISGLSVFLEPPHRRVLVVNLFVNLVFEYWVRTLEMKGWLQRTPARETLLFMLSSSVLFYLMRKEREKKNRTPIFWFFTPPRVSKTTGPPVGGVRGRSDACPHGGSCMAYVLKGTAKMFGIGCGMTLLRTVVPRLLTPRKALGAVTPRHLRLGLFFGGYIGIYRLVVCALCRRHGRDDARWALPAGLLAGLAFRASPSLPIALAPLTGSLQALPPTGLHSDVAADDVTFQIGGSELYRRGVLPEGWPLVELLYCLCQGLLFHARVMHEDTCPRYIHNLMKTVTSSKANEIQAGFIQKLLMNR